MAVKIVGDTGLVVQQGASVNVAELETREIRIEGDYDELCRTFQQGGQYSGLDYIRSVQVQGDEGGRGIATLTVVGDISASTTEGIYFGTTWEIDIKEVSKSLKTHPHLTASDLNIVRLWEGTPEAKRVQYATDGTPSFFYYDTDGMPTEEEPDAVPVPSTAIGALDYMAASIAGIETYNIYLPIIRRNRQYVVRPPIQSGTGRVGTFTPPSGITLSGFDSQNFYKSADKYSKAADGSWTRTEEWTYTNDRSHDWIYSNT